MGFFKYDSHPEVLKTFPFTLGLTDAFFLYQFVILKNLITLQQETFNCVTLRLNRHGFVWFLFAQPYLHCLDALSVINTVVHSVCRPGLKHSSCLSFSEYITVSVHVLMRVHRCPLCCCGALQSEACVIVSSVMSAADTLVVSSGLRRVGTVPVHY